MRRKEGINHSSGDTVNNKNLKGVLTLPHPCHQKHKGLMHTERFYSSCFLARAWRRARVGWAPPLTQSGLVILYIWVASPQAAFSFCSSNGYSCETKCIFLPSPCQIHLASHTGSASFLWRIPLRSVVKFPYEGDPPRPRYLGLGYWSLDAGKTVLPYGWLGLIQSLLPGELWPHTPYLINLALSMFGFPCKMLELLSGLPSSKMAPCLLPVAGLGVALSWWMDGVPDGLPWLGKEQQDEVGVTYGPL